MENPVKAPICKLQDIPAEGVKAVTFFDREYLVYRAGGEPRAVLNACMHLGGPLERKGDRFVCPWHGASFACSSGVRESGPQGTHDRLLTLPTRSENGELVYVYGE